jgi:arabinogalactan oligomer/maltooligosaccharide transport system substrate-binding protein
MQLVRGLTRMNADPDNPRESAFIRVPFSHPTQHSAHVLLVALFLLTLLLLAACASPVETPTPAAQPAAGGSDAGAIQSSTAEDATPQVGGEPEVDQPPATSTSVPTPTPQPLNGRVVLWHSWAGADGDALTAILTALRERAPGLQVDTLFVAPNELPQAYADALRNGGGPDLAVTANWWLDDLIAAGAATPLDAVIPSATTGRSWPSTLQAFQRAGQTYGLPITFETVSLFWNRELVAAEQLPATTDDLLALAEATSSQGTGLYANLYHTWWGFPAYGAQLFDDTGRVILDQSSGAAEFLAWMQRLNQTPGSFVDSDYGMLLDRFKKGEFAFLVDGPWASADLRGALGDVLAVAQLPAGPSAPAQPWLSADGLLLNPNLAGDQQLVALAVMDVLSNAESGSAFASIAGRLPANRDAILPDDPLLQGFMAQAASAVPAPTRPEMEQVWGYGGDMLIKAINGSAEPTAAVQETAALINEANGKQ